MVETKAFFWTKSLLYVWFSYSNVFSEMHDLSTSFIERQFHILVLHLPALASITLACSLLVPSVLVTLKDGELASQPVVLIKLVWLAGLLDLPSLLLSTQEQS